MAYVWCRYFSPLYSLVGPTAGRTMLCKWQNPPPPCNVNMFCMSGNAPIGYWNAILSSIPDFFVTGSLGMGTIIMMTSPCSLFFWLIQTFLWKRYRYQEKLCCNILGWSFILELIWELHTWEQLNCNWCTVFFPVPFPHKFTLNKPWKQLYNHVFENRQTSQILPRWIITLFFFSLNAKPTNLLRYYSAVKCTSYKFVWYVCSKLWFFAPEPLCCRYK